MSTLAIALDIHPVSWHQEDPQSPRIRPTLQRAISAISLLIASHTLAAAGNTYAVLLSTPRGAVHAAMSPSLVDKTASNPISVSKEEIAAILTDAVDTELEITEGVFAEASPIGVVAQMAIVIASKTVGTAILAVPSLAPEALTPLVHGALAIEAVGAKFSVLWLSATSAGPLKHGYTALYETVMMTNGTMLHLDPTNHACFLPAIAAPPIRPPINRATDVIDGDFRVTVICDAEGCDMKLVTPLICNSCLSMLCPSHGSSCPCCNTEWTEITEFNPTFKRDTRLVE